MSVHLRLCHIFISLFLTVAIVFYSLPLSLFLCGILTFSFYHFSVSGFLSLFAALFRSQMSCHSEKVLTYILIKSPLGYMGTFNKRVCYPQRDTTCKVDSYPTPLVNILCTVLLSMWKNVLQKQDKTFLCQYKHRESKSNITCDAKVIPRCFWQSKVQCIFI